MRNGIRSFAITHKKTDNQENDSASDARHATTAKNVPSVHGHPAASTSGYAVSSTPRVRLCGKGPSCTHHRAYLTYAWRSIRKHPSAWMALYCPDADATAADSYYHLTVLQSPTAGAQNGAESPASRLFWRRTGAPPPHSKPLISW